MEITDNESNYGYNKFSDLEDIFSNAARLTAAKEFLTYAKVVNAWKRNGPVAAKLLTWIRNQESIVAQKFKANWERLVLPNI